MTDLGFFLFSSDSPSWFWPGWMALKICCQHEKVCPEVCLELAQPGVSREKQVSSFPEQVSSLLCLDYGAWIS